MTSLQVLFIQAIDVFFNVIEWLIFIRILLSWIPMFGYNNPLGRLIYNLTEPILGPCRSMLEKSPLGGGMMLVMTTAFKKHQRLQELALGISLLFGMLATQAIVG